MTDRTLFAIDVASEIRSLCDAQLRGTWQMPAELVRYAVRLGAREVSVAGAIRGSSISWRGGPIDISTLEDLATALDETADAGRRQRSIADLERSGAEALLWAGGLPGASLTIEDVADGRHRRFRRRAGRRPSLQHSRSSAPRDAVVVRWSCAKLDGRRAMRWLRLACRFSDLEITLDGRPAARGFSEGLYRTRLRDPLPCTLGLTRRGDDPVLWLLRDGIVAARAVVAGTASSSELRRAVRPYVQELCERAVDMMIEVAGRARADSRGEGQRLVTLLLASAKRGIRAAEIRSLPLIPTLRGRERPVSVAQLEEVAAKRGGWLYAVEPGAEADRVVADSTSIIVASPEVRRLLTEVTGVRLQTPPRRPPGVFRRTVRGIRHLASTRVEMVRGFLGSRLVASGDVSAGERRLLAVVRDALAPQTIELGSGRHLRRTGTGWILPRNDPAVVAAVRCVGSDPAWLYPLFLALQLDPPSAGCLRDDWTTGIENGSGSLGQGPERTGRNGRSSR